MKIKKLKISFNKSKVFNTIWKSFAILLAFVASGFTFLVAMFSSVIFAIILVVIFGVPLYFLIKSCFKVKE